MTSKKKTRSKIERTPAFTLVNLHLPGPPLLGATPAINNYGQIVGTLGASGSEQAFLWQPNRKNALKGTVYNLPTNAGRTSYAMDINRYGEVTGYMMDGSGKMAQVVWKPNRKNASPSRSNPMLPKTINANGTSIAPATLIDIPYGGINDEGWVASDEFDPAGNQVRGTFYDGMIHELESHFLAARAINNNGQVVGHSMPGSQAARWIPDASNPQNPGTYIYLGAIAPPIHQFG